MLDYLVSDLITDLVLGRGEIIRNSQLSLFLLTWTAFTGIILTLMMISVEIIVRLPLLGGFFFFFKLKLGLPI